MNAGNNLKKVLGIVCGMGCQRVMLEKGMCSLIIVDVLKSDVRKCVTHCCEFI